MTKLCLVSRHLGFDGQKRMKVGGIHFSKWYLLGNDHEILPDSDPSC